MKLSTAAKFNAVFLSIFALGFGAASVVTNYLLQQNAREETLERACVLMQSALAARSYTSAQIVPLLQTRLKHEFVPQLIPSFAATEQLSHLLKQHPDFTYKEATLNPTNLRDRAADWEAYLVNTLRARTDPKELVGERAIRKGWILNSDIAHFLSNIRSKQMTRSFPTAAIQVPLHAKDWRRSGAT